MGVANLFGAAFNCYTTTGSFSRSAVMDTSGAKSQLAGIVSAIVVMFVLLFLTPVFKNMPQNVLGAIVIGAVVSLFNYSEWFFLWKVSSQHAASKLHTNGGFVSDATMPASWIVESNSSVMSDSMCPSVTEGP